MTDTRYLKKRDELISSEVLNFVAMPVPSERFEKIMMNLWRMTGWTEIETIWLKIWTTSVLKKCREYVSLAAFSASDHNEINVEMSIFEEC